MKCKYIGPWLEEWIQVIYKIVYQLASKQLSLSSSNSNSNSNAQSSDVVVASADSNSMESLAVAMKMAVQLTPSSMIQDPQGILQMCLLEMIRIPNQSKTVQEILRYLI